MDKENKQSFYICDMDYGQRINGPFIDDHNYGLFKIGSSDDKSKKMCELKGAILQRWILERDKQLEDREDTEWDKTLNEEMAGTKS